MEIGICLFQVLDTRFHIALPQRFFAFNQIQRRFLRV